MLEIEKLHLMLTDAGIPHTYTPLYDGYIIKVYHDEAMKKEFDDCIYHHYSNGYKLGLLDTYRISECGGSEDAETVFKNWYAKYIAVKCADIMEKYRHD